MHSDFNTLAKRIVDILMIAYGDVDKVHHVLLKCVAKLKQFEPKHKPLIGLTTCRMELSGLYYFPKVIGPELSADIIDYLNDQEWKGVSASETGRKVQQYGFEYDYSTRKGSEFKKVEDIPELLLTLQKLGLDVIDDLKLDKCSLNQCIVNKYEPKQGISAHVDKPNFGPVIACFTLGSGTTMSFSRLDGDGVKHTYDKYVEPNSVYFMTGESRYLWKHEIKPKMTDLVDSKKVRRTTRISVTFRTVSKST